ncbi:unnamed protein product [Larinioides sclopetarius]|uniref:Uncharacterized protein n=1 Tax=Larinioides sclopetarius TaxID=280406 RepID=A0AAV2BTT7_9ARAC
MSSKSDTKSKDQVQHQVLIFDNSIMKIVPVKINSQFSHKEIPTTSNFPNSTKYRAIFCGIYKMLFALRQKDAKEEDFYGKNGKITLSYLFHRIRKELRYPRNNANTTAEEMEKIIMVSCMLIIFLITLVLLLAYAINYIMKNLNCFADSLSVSSLSLKRIPTVQSDICEEVPQIGRNQISDSRRELYSESLKADLSSAIEINLDATDTTGLTVSFINSAS